MRSHKFFAPSSTIFSRVTLCPLRQMLRSLASSCQQGKCDTSYSVCTTRTTHSVKLAVNYHYLARFLLFPFIMFFNISLSSFFGSDCAKICAEKRTITKFCTCNDPKRESDMSIKVSEFQNSRGTSLLH